LFSPAFLDVPTFHHQVPPRPPRRERSQRRKWELWARMLSGNFAEKTTSTPFRYLLHAANLRHGTDGFTSPTKEDVLRIFFALKNPTASAGFEPANLGTKGQHATPRPHKPLCTYYYWRCLVIFLIYPRLLCHELYLCGSHFNYVLFSTHVKSSKILCHVLST